MGRVRTAAQRTLHPTVGTNSGRLSTQLAIFTDPSHLDEPTIPIAQQGGKQDTKGRGARSHHMPRMEEDTARPQGPL